MNARTLSWLVASLLVLSMLLVATPVTAAENEPVGDRINLYFGSTQEFPAGAPFYIMHGWVQPSTDDAIGIFDFHVEMDGAVVKESFKWFFPVVGDPDLLNRRWVFNFPDGMTGTHTFTGHWFAPCQYAVDQLGYPGSCDTPNAKVETNSRTLTVEFIP